VQLFFTSKRKVWKVGGVAALDRHDLVALFEQRSGVLTLTRNQGAPAR